MLVWPELSPFQQDLLLVVTSAVFGGGGAAYLTNNQFGRQHSMRDDRKLVLDTWLPQLWDQVNARRSKLAHATSRPLVEIAPFGEIQDHIWRTLQRTTWRDRRNWQKYSDADPLGNSDAYRLAHRQFEWYLLRQFDTRPMRVWRWLEDMDRARSYRKGLRQ